MGRHWIPFVGRIDQKEDDESDEEETDDVTTQRLVRTLHTIAGRARRPRRIWLGKHPSMQLRTTPCSSGLCQAVQDYAMKAFVC